jgi:hypothetical protein
MVPPVIPGLRRQKQEDQEFEASLSYVVRACLKTNPVLKAEAPRGMPECIDEIQ